MPTDFDDLLSELLKDDPGPCEPSQDFRGRAVNLSGHLFHRELHCKGCKFRGIDLSHATFLRSVTFEDCRFEGDVDFGHLRVSGALVLKNCHIPRAGAARTGLVDMHAMQIGGALSLNGSVLERDLLLNNSRLLRGFRFRASRQENGMFQGRCRSIVGEDVEVHRELDLGGLCIQGNLDLGRASIKAGLQLAWDPYLAEADQCSCRTIITGCCDLHEARFEGGIDFSGAFIWGDVLLQSAEIGGDLRLDAWDLPKRRPSLRPLPGSNPRKTTIVGCVDATSAKIRHQVLLQGCNIGELNLQSAEVGSDILAASLSPKLRTTIGCLGDGGKLAVSLASSHVRGMVDLRGAYLKGPLNADYATMGEINLESTEETGKTSIAAGKHSGQFAYSVCFNSATINGRFLARECEFKGPIDGASAHIKGDFNVSDATVHGGEVTNGQWGTAKMGIWLRHATVDGQCLMRETKFRPGESFDKGKQPPGSALCLWDARLGGLVTLEGAELGSCDYVPGGKKGSSLYYSIDARNVKIAGSLILDGANAPDVVDLSEAHIEGLRIRGDEGRRRRLRGLNLRAIRIEGDLIADRHTRIGTFRSRGLRTSLLLVGAKVSGVVDLRGATFYSAINADFATLGAGLLLSNGWEAEEGGKAGGTTVGWAEHEDRFVYSVCFNAAEITGNVVARYGDFRGCVDGAGAHIRGDLDFTGSTIIGGEVHNEIWAAQSGFWMRRVHVEGQLLLRKARIYGTIGPKKRNGSLDPGKDICVGKITEGAAANLLNAVVDGMVDLSGAQIARSTLQPGSQYNDQVDDRDAGSVYSVDLRNAHVGGVFKCGEKARLRSNILLKDSNIAGIDLSSEFPKDRTIVGGSIVAPFTHLHGSVLLDHCRVLGGIDLRYGHVEGSFEYSDKNGGETCGLLLFEGAENWHPEQAPPEEAVSGNLSLRMQGLTIDGPLHLRGLWAAGAANMRGIQIGGALHADPNGEYPTHLGRGRYRSREFSLRLSSARIAGDVNLSGIECDSAISLRSSEIGADAILFGAWIGPGKRMTSKSAIGLVLHLTRVSGTINAQGVRFRDDATVHAQALTVGNDLVLTIEAKNEAGEPRDLSCYDASGRLEGGDYVLDLKNAVVPGRITLQGHTGVRRWLTLENVKMGEVELTLIGSGPEPDWEDKELPLNLFGITFGGIEIHPEVSQEIVGGPPEENHLKKWLKKIACVGEQRYSERIFRRFLILAAVSLALSALSLLQRRNPPDYASLYALSAALLASVPFVFLLVPDAAWWAKGELSWIRDADGKMPKGFRSVIPVLWSALAVVLVLLFVLLGPLMSLLVVPVIGTAWAVLSAENEMVEEDESIGRKARYILKASRFSNSLYLKFIDHCAVLANRDDADDIFKALKEREIARSVSPHQPLLNLINKMSGFGAYFSRALFSFLVAWQIGVVAFTILGPVDYLDEIHKTPNAYGPYGILATFLLNVLMPLRYLLPIVRLDSLGTLKNEALLPLGPLSFTIGTAAAVLQLVGIVTIPVFVLYFAGLFRRHRHSSAVS